MNRGSFVLFILAVIAVAAAIAWSVTQGIPGIVKPLGTHDASKDPDVALDRSIGTPPLGVTFSIKRDIGTIQTINYGDGTSSSISDFVCGLTYCIRLHTYREPGIYKIHFENATGEPLYSLTVTVAEK
jgi:hypothetical protein